MRALVRPSLIAGWIGLLPVAVFAQGAVGGVVRDSSGGVLPGVTVEAASPALIERARTVVTDDRGQYLIVDLRPGVYSVTFTLSGFTTLKREGLELSTGVTLPINAELNVAAVEQIVTVTTTTPVVDVKNTQQETVMTRDVLDAIPRTNQQLQTGLLVPGMVLSGPVDVGGSVNNPVVQLSIHGGTSADQIWAIDGTKVTEGTLGAQRALIIGDNTAQEYTYETSAFSAEFPTGGVRMNLIPKEGGNTFKGSIFGDYTSEGMVSDNLSAELKARGLTSPTRISKIWDISPALGGPILRDRLWFFGAYRNWGNSGFPPGAYYLTDPTRPAVADVFWWNADARLTWQATPRNKFSVFNAHEYVDFPHLSPSNLVPPEVDPSVVIQPINFTQIKWNSPVTNRVLIEASAYHYHQKHIFGVSAESRYTVGDPAPVDPSAWPTLELTTGKWIAGSEVNTGAFPSTLEASWWGESGALSYVTGSNNLKVGFTDVQGYWFSFYPAVPPVLELYNGQPFQVQLIAKPGESLPRVNQDFGLYAQDQWTRRRLTLNLGLRFDYFNGQVDAEYAPASQWFAPVRQFPVIPDVPSWKDIDPRFGLVYDVFGNGKTSIKTSLSRYVAGQATSFQTSVDPLGGGLAGGAADIRSWTDPVHDDCPLACSQIPTLNQLGPSTNLNYGKPVFASQPTDQVRSGWGARGYNWEYAASIQHELLPRLALNVGYYRRSFGNLTWTENTLVTANDYTPFTIVSPLNSEQITLYNLNPAKRGISNNLITFAPNNTQVFNGVDVTLNGRFGRGGVVNGGVSMGRTVTSTCTTIDPNALRFCNVTPPFMAGNQYKLVAAYPLPYDVQVSGTFQSVPGPLISANYTITSAIAGVPLTLGSLSVPLVQPGTLYGDRSNRVDLRFEKTLRVGSIRFLPYVDLLNVFNAAPVLTENATYGALWRQPLTVLVGRMIQVAMRVNF